MSDQKKPNYRRPSKRLTELHAAFVKYHLERGAFQHILAAQLEVNPARISNIKTGKTFPHVVAAETPDMPNI